MFGKHKLLTEGTQAQALVTSSGNYWVNPGSAPGRYAVGLQVRFPDGSTAEIERHVSGVSIDAGDVVPVRFDPNATSKVEVDLAAMLALRQAQVDGARARAVETSERELRRADLVREIATRETPPTDAELQAVADQEKAAKEELGNSIRRRAGAAPSEDELSESSRLTDAVRDARAELEALKALRPDWSPADAEPS
jgi:hypothetical protein